VSRWDHRYLGHDRFPATLSKLEIEHFFTLNEVELDLVRERRTRLNRLALGLQIGFLKMTGGTLNSVEIIPVAVLQHLGHQLACPPPWIASIRAFYRRRRTLFDHQAAALRALGRIELSPHAERGLVAYLRREAAAVFDHAELMARARSWLVEHHYLLLRERDIRRLVNAARRHHEQVLFRAITAAVPTERDSWLLRLLAPIDGTATSHLEWLGDVPATRSTRSLQEQIEKTCFLKELGADQLALRNLPMTGLEHFAKRMATRKPAALARLKDPYRTIELACFLRITLLRLRTRALPSSIIRSRPYGGVPGNAWRNRGRVGCAVFASCSAISPGSSMTRHSVRSISGRGCAV